jgi:hypothetical protein
LINAPEEKGICTGTTCTTKQLLYNFDASICPNCVSGKVIIKYHLGAEDGDEENSGNGSSFGFARGHLIPDLNSKTLPEYSSEHYTFSKSHSPSKYYSEAL